MDAHGRQFSLTWRTGVAAIRRPAGVPRSRGTALPGQLLQAEPYGEYAIGYPVERGVHVMRGRERYLLRPSYLVVWDPIPLRQPASSSSTARSPSRRPHWSARLGWPIGCTQFGLDMVRHRRRGNRRVAPPGRPRARSRPPRCCARGRHGHVRPDAVVPGGGSDCRSPSTPGRR